MFSLQISQCIFCLFSFLFLFFNNATDSTLHSSYKKKNSASLNFTFIFRSREKLFFLVEYHSFIMKLKQNIFQGIFPYALRSYEGQWDNGTLGET